MGMARVLVVRQTGDLYQSGRLHMELFSLPSHIAKANAQVLPAEGPDEQLQ
jgi:hypothetical protein